MLLLSASRQRSTAIRWLRTTAIAAFAGLTVVSVAGCTSGFAPMYASSIDGRAPLSDRLKSVEFETIPGRVGQRIRNELLFFATGGGEADVPREYRLDVAIRERTTASLVTASGDPGNRIYSLDANFRLVRLADNKVVLTGTSFGRANMQRYDSIYSNVRAVRDAEDRAARTVAQDMKSRLEAYLAGAA